MRRAVLAPVVMVALVLGAVPGARAQSALERPTNLGGGWVAGPGVVHFHFLHRFSVIGDVDKVTNSPSFLLAAGLPANVMTGLVYASNSTVSPEPRPNEWEAFARWRPIGGSPAWPVGVAVQAGYNTAAESVDGEITATGSAGRVSLVGALRALGRPYGGEDPRLAVGGGLVVRLGRWLALTGDGAALTDREPAERVAWSAGVALGIPYTPHTLSLHATNATTGTLQGASRGGPDTLWGFEFTVPLTLRRFFGRPAATAAAAPAPPPAPAESAGKAAADGKAMASGDTVQVAMDGLEFAPARIEIAPGTTVVWTNRAPLAHSVNADDGGWESPLLDPGASWARTFAEPGEFTFHCAPHPFMKGVVVVRR